MLILIKHIPRRGAEYAPPVRAMGINPEAIDRVVEGSVVGFDRPCVELHVGEEVIFCEGTVEEIVTATWYPPCPELDSTDTE